MKPIHLMLSCVLAALGIALFSTDISLVLASGALAGVTALLVTPYGNRLSFPLRRLRTHPLILWLLLWFYIVGIFCVWISAYQPVWGQIPEARELIFLLIAAWGFLLVAIYGMQTDEARTLGAALAKSRLTGLLITLTSLTLMFFGVELVMRATIVRSDGFAFTVMHRQWERLYWNPINALGYRDFEPNIDPSRQHVLVIGDSFASGWGVNNIEDTFPHQLESELGIPYAVNVAAQPGWETNQQLEGLRAYPSQPDIIVLSYFVNDIGYLTPDTNRANLAVFRFPQYPIEAWMVHQLFTASFLYWHVFQAHAQQGGSGSYADQLLTAYNDDARWAQHTADLVQFIDYAQAIEARFLVLIWPMPEAIPQSAPITLRVADFFRTQNVPVVDMGEVLRETPASAIVVNPFDGHPHSGIHQLAAELLAEAINR